MPRGLWIAIGLLVVFGVLYAWHFFLYYSTVHFFGLAGRGSRRLLALILLLLPASFFFTEIVFRRSEGPFVRAFATMSTLWLGVGLAFMLFFALAWVAWGLARFHNPRPSPLLFGSVAVLLTVFYCAYGIWNACHPRIENVTVKVANLPQQWEGRKLVQITDVHLGHILGASFLEGVVKKVNAQQPDVVLITGDLFDGGDGDLDRLTGPLHQLHAPLGIYFVTGNHEGFIGIESALAALRKTPVRVLQDEMVVVDGLQILGVSYPRGAFSRDISSAIARIKEFDRGKPSILLYHSPSQIPRVKAAGISLQISGHTHSGQMFPFQYVTRMVYGKYHRGLNVEDNFAIYTSTGTGTWGPMMRTGNHPEITVFRLTK